MHPAIFLDRDETLIEDMGYSADPQRVRLKAGSAEAVRRLRAAGYRVVVVTNQSGVARGHFTEEQLARAHERLQGMLQSEGARLDAIYYCPYLNSAEVIATVYRRDSELRKPRPGMLLQAAADLQLDLQASWMIGDAQRDVEAGRAAGCRTILVGNATSIRPLAADFTAPDLLTAAEIVLANGRGPSAGSPAGGGETVREPAPPRATRDATMVMEDLLHEIRHWRREARTTDYSGAHLIGAVSQAFAAIALLWGLYAFYDSPTDAFLRLMAAVAFQLIALTYLRRR